MPLPHETPADWVPVAYSEQEAQDAADGRALRLLREALPDDGAWRVDVSFFGRSESPLRVVTVRRHASPVVYTAEATAISEAADACREALS